MEKLAINPPTLHAAPGYSQIIRVTGGTTIYIAGQVAWDAGGKLVGPGDLEAQARQAFTNLLAALSAAGAQPSDLVKVGIYVVGHSPEKLGIIRAVRDEIFQAGALPTSTLIGVQSLALPDLLIEVDAIAVID
ncbi:MAG: RidA family protein [Acidimicrobiia bacterium]